MRRALLVAALAATGCAVDMRAAAPVPMPWGQRLEFACLEQTSMTIDFVPASRSARVFVDGQTLLLPQVESATDAKFSDGRYILYVEAPRAVLEDNGQVIRRMCTPR